MLPDCRVLDTLAVEMDVDLFTQTPAAAANELERLGRHVGVAPPGPSVEPAEPLRPEFFGQAVLATWRQLLDESSLAVDEPALAGTARPAQLRLQPAPRPSAWAWRRVRRRRCAPSAARSRCRW